MGTARGQGAPSERHPVAGHRGYAYRTRAKGAAVTTIEVERVTVEQLENERNEFLREVGATWEELQARIAGGDYSVRERDVSERIENINFLLSIS